MMTLQKYGEVRRFISQLDSDFEKVTCFRPITLRPVEVASLLDKLQGIYDSENVSVDPSVAAVGSELKLLNMEDYSECSFILNLPQNANPDIGSISVLSPLGSSLIGRKKGEIVTIYLGNNLSRFCIVSVKPTA